MHTNISFISVGLPEFDFPPMDPLLYEYDIFEFNLDLLRGKIIISNCTITGLAKARFFDARPHFLDDVFRMEIEGQIPKLRAKGFANVNATISIFRVIDEGTILHVVCISKKKFVLLDAFLFINIKD